MVKFESGQGEHNYLIVCGGLWRWGGVLYMYTCKWAYTINIDFYLSIIFFSACTIQRH